MMSYDERFAEQQAARIEALEDELRRLYRARIEALTACQTTILQLAAEGRRDSAIAAELRVSPATVSHHFRSIRRRLGATSREHAISMLKGVTP